MLILSTFEHSLEIEEALAVLEHMGIGRQRIMLVAMDNPIRLSAPCAVQASSRATLAFEVGMAAATALSVIGICYGFVLVWGPIIWGILTALAGFIIGFGITRWVQNAREAAGIKMKGRIPELTLIVRCPEEQLQDVCRVLSQYHALSVGQIQERLS